jgi:hypothetical protein
VLSSRLPQHLFTPPSGHLHTVECCTTALVIDISRELAILRNPSSPQRTTFDRHADRLSLPANCTHGRCTLTHLPLPPLLLRGPDATSAASKTGRLRSTKHCFRGAALCPPRPLPIRSSSLGKLLQLPLANGGVTKLPHCRLPDSNHHQP